MTQKEKASANKRRQQGPDIEDESDAYYFDGEDLDKRLANEAMGKGKKLKVSEYINIGEVVDRIFTSSEYD